MVPKAVTAEEPKPTAIGPTVTELLGKHIAPIWIGDTIESIESADEVIRNTPHTGPTEVECLRFCRGDQWVRAIQLKRWEDGRPCLTINRLPALISAATRKGGRELSSEEYIQLCCAIARRNMDAQRLYNFTYSALVEQVRLAGKRIVCN